MRPRARRRAGRAASRRRNGAGGLEPLLRAAELVDAGTGRHLNRVAFYAGLTAHALGLEDSRCELISSACRLHDIGKLGVSGEILRKPGPLSASERREMERHSAIGHDILADTGSELLELAAEVALTHHEWFDGRGYPNALRGDEISLVGRIAAVADAFDALTSDRVYRPAVSRAEAVRLLRSASGSQFDPAVVDAFLESVEKDTPPPWETTSASPERRIPSQLEGSGARNGASALPPRNTRF
jgi:HD-GYP domain-containing protein (c-di-GMP phosphodiesterase class II)